MTAADTDIAEGLVVTIDGPAGTGKSTVAHMLARRLGLDFLDTGAMYRAVALLALDRGIDPADGDELAAAVRAADLHFEWRCDPPAVMLGSRDVTGRLRDLDVSGIVSIVAAQPEVRTVLVEHQRRIARRHPRLVTEGRDQGSIVFPDAPLRFYLDADETERARRRVRQLAAVGKDVDEAAIISEIRRRDHIDSSRAVAPLIRPEGAIAVDTSSRTLEEVVDLLESIARERLPAAEFDR